MQVIGDRVSILRKEDVLSIVILPTTDKKKLGLLFLWLFAWTACGAIVLINYFQVTDRNSKLFLIIYLSFWAYFEFKIARAFAWKKFGKEKLWIQSGTLHYQREMNKKGKILEYNLDLVSKLRLLELNTASFTDSINQSFWVKGGERLEFDALSKNIQLGMQLSDEEARAILNEVNRFIK